MLRLREIEDIAGTRFYRLGLIDEALDPSFPLDELARLIGLGQAWVACMGDDVAVGMAIASVREGAAYLEEMDVLRAHGRRGLGGRLLEHVCAWARMRGQPAVTLSTFRDVPWNGPFYRQRGFRELHPAEWTPGMRAIRAKEARHGLHVEVRVFMRRELSRTGERRQLTALMHTRARMKRAACVDATSLHAGTRRRHGARGRDARAPALARSPIQPPSPCRRYSQMPTHAGGIGGATWSVVSGVLPAGLVLSGDGVLSGTPLPVATTTVFYFSALVSDQAGDTAARNYALAEQAP
ncbi:MAG: GNAT family N-acetyltransferase [Mizugakiibacter sp.]|uniref:GNAT family N-acetyltransferase n=1 Tax=Mizugakiibacter sp. TaxID=1972610 RepID=UPI00320C7B62